MPNRILKESICSNEQINQLDAFSEVFFYRLIVNVDDYGRFDGRPAILRSRLFPLKDVRNSQIEDALSKLSSVELVETYVVGGKPFVRLTGWERNQQIRAKKSKFPEPDNICNQMISNDIKCYRNPIQSESNPNPEPQSETCAYGGGGRPDFDTLEAYCSSNLQYVSPRNMEDIAAYKDELPEDVIRHAVDVACAQGKRTWAYTNSILRRYVERGFKTLGDVKADEDRYAAGKEKTEKQAAPRMKQFD